MANQKDLKDLTGPEVIEVFINNILAEIGLDKAPEKDRAEFKEKLLTELQARIGVVVINSLPEAKQAEFAKLMEGGATDEKTINEFMQTNVPDLEKVILAGMKEFKEEFIEEFQKAMQEEAESLTNAAQDKTSAEYNGIEIEQAA